MTPTIKIDTSQLSAAMRDFVPFMKRELSDEVNKRMFYVLLRAFLILVPYQIGAAKQKVKAYLEASREGTARAIHLITQSRRMKRGLNAALPHEIRGTKSTGKNKGDFMAEVTSIRRAGAAQGYVKSAIARALQSISKANIGRSFSQFGRKAKLSKRTGAVLKPEQPPNAALMKLSAEYGQTIPAGSQSNVGVFRGTKAQVSVAKPGFNPVITAHMEGKSRPEEVSKVNGLLAAAMQRAVNDEAVNLRNHMVDRAQKVADKFSA